MSTLGRSGRGARWGVSDILRRWAATTSGVTVKRPCGDGERMGAAPAHDGVDDVVGWEVVGGCVLVVLWLVGDYQQVVLPRPRVIPT